jgi:hypothetical protein
MISYSFEKYLDRVSNYTLYIVLPVFELEDVILFYAGSLKLFGLLY